jgi:3-hydroxyisobutyrate dehydrogenase
MAGGAEEQIARARPVLAALGRPAIHCGSVGSAQVAKALNNLVSAGGFLIGIEALLIGHAYGLDPGVMIDVLNASSGMNNSTQNKFRQFVLSRSFDSGFTLDFMVKDLATALAAGRQTHAVTPFAALCLEMWSSALAALGPGHDHTAMARVSETHSGCAPLVGAEEPADGDQRHASHEGMAVASSGSGIGGKAVAQVDQRLLGDLQQPLPRTVQVDDQVEDRGKDQNHRDQGE